MKRRLATWDQVMARVLDEDKMLKLTMYGQGMFTVDLDGSAEGDLTEDEAIKWILDHLDH